MAYASDALNERKQIILKAIVNDYTSTAEPVSSEMLAYRYRLGVKPATIRNEMAEMSELGYLRQPHTSAGRVPSDMGYRFYVDWLMSGPGLSSAEEAKAVEGYANAPAETDALLQLTCRLLSTLTHYASIATEPATNTATIRHISLSLMGGRNMLLAVVTSDGRVEHSILDLPSPTTHRRTARLSNLLSEQFGGLRIDSVQSHNLDSAPEGATDIASEYKMAVRALKRLVREMCQGSVRLDGAGHILSQPEFKDIRKLEALLLAFEERRLLYQTLNAAMNEARSAIIIGNENAYPEMRECSFVTATYRIGGRASGAIGVMGPTRMNYRRAVAAVNLLAQNLSELLTTISIG
ncbi:MAG: heat-inducible transcriptional repressor HrcA [Armatimonadota bacterium]|nr:heat-inducible transcriptional repressor HrcA [Armatimonadota bacterium]